MIFSIYTLSQNEVFSTTYKSKNVIRTTIIYFSAAYFLNNSSKNILYIFDNAPYNTVSFELIIIKGKILVCLSQHKKKIQNISTLM